MNIKIPFKSYVKDLFKSRAKNVITSRKWESKYTPIKLDVVIPCLNRDIDLLEYCISGLRENLMHPIGTIFLVAPLSMEICEVAKRNYCTFVCEDELAMRPKDYRYIVQGVDRTGWIVQQLIKLNASIIVDTDSYWVCDADTVLVSPQSLISGSKYILNISDEFHFPYRYTIANLTGQKPWFPFSFVSHNMIFNKPYLVSLKSRIETYTRMEWSQAIWSNLDDTQQSSFSEYELYGNYVISSHLAAARFEYFHNLSLPRSAAQHHERDKSKYLGVYKAVSYHHYS